MEKKQLKIAWTAEYIQPLPEGHRFPMEKYELIPMQLVHEGTISESQLIKPGKMEEEIIREVHSAEYWNKLKALELSRSEERKTGFPLTDSLVDREIMIMEGTRLCAEWALENGVAMNVAGGTHHAFTDRGEGFCLLNDQALAAKYLLRSGKAKRILIIDLDVHQGNGTAEIFRNEESVFTFSVHGEHNYPLQKEQSDLDIGLPDGIETEPYLKIIREKVPQLIDLHEPDMVFFQSGVDILETDKLGRLKVSREGCKERDQIVLEACHRNKLPVVISMGGGYSERIQDIVEAHANTFRLAQEIFF